MDSGLLKLLVLGTMISSAIALVACGGGDNPPSPVAEVVTVKKAIPRGRNAAFKEVEVIGFEAKFRILDIRCAFLFNAPLNSTGAPEFVLLLGVSAADVEKAKAYGFSLATSDDLARKDIVVCT